MKAPQIIVICLMAIDFAVSAIKVGDFRGTYNPIHSLINAGIMSALLWWGGFF
jgi:hypothetical protein